MRLPVDLVVLSGCETGLGEQINGEGLLSLTRGFMYAGAARVVASLWSVSDIATPSLMQDFYRAMERDGTRPAAALRVAQIKMWRQNNGALHIIGRHFKSKVIGNKFSVAPPTRSPGR